MSEIHDSPGWHTGAYTGCISVPAVIGKSPLYLSLQAPNLQQTSLDKFDTYVSMFIMNYPSLSVLKCIRHFLRSLFWFSRIIPWLYPDIDMAASAGTSAEKHGCAKAVRYCLFCLSAPSDSKQIPLFPLQVFDIPCRTAQHECSRIDLRGASDLSLRVLGRTVPGRRVT